MNFVLSFVEHFPFGLVAGLFVFALYWLAAFFIIYHLVRFGIGPRPKLLAFIFVIGSAILFGLVITSYTTINVADLGQLWTNSLHGINLY